MNVLYSSNYIAPRDGFSGQFIRIFKIDCFCFVVAICDLVHDVEVNSPSLTAIITASGYLFRNMSDALETAICRFTGITHV